MTEEDTFNKLKRITYDEMYRIFVARPNGMSDIEKCQLLIEHHWNPVEFYTQFYDDAEAFNKRIADIKLAIKQLKANSND